MHKKRLISDKKRLLQRRETTKRLIQERATAYEKANAELSADEAYSQLLALEKRWVQLEKGNYQMHHFITSKEVCSQQILPPPPTPAPTTMLTVSDHCSPRHTSKVTLRT